MIFIRAEKNPAEMRTPLVPRDVKTLIEENIQIFVQSCTKRIYKDDEYKAVGATIVENEWYEPEYKNALILGLKELDQNSLPKLNNHVHIYFSHTYKNQSGSNEILKMFKKSKSILYDFEYFTDINNKRIIGFSLYAGYVGATLGIQQYNNKLNIPLKPWNSFEEMLSDSIHSLTDKSIPKIGIIGYRGKCGIGVCNVLDNLCFDYIKIDEINSENRGVLSELDIFYNCICLKDDYNQIWFDENLINNKKMVIVDISCDVSKPNNPIKIYNQCTTFENPVYKHGDIDIIAISNLPSLLPIDSSSQFSSVFMDLLSNTSAYSWSKNYDIFCKKMNNIIDDE